MGLIARCLGCRRYLFRSVVLWQKKIRRDRNSILRKLFFMSLRNGFSMFALLQELLELSGKEAEEHTGRYG